MLNFRDGLEPIRIDLIDPPSVAAATNQPFGAN